MKRLIINSDDFGLTVGVNQAISELHTRRVLTSTTLMAMAAQTTDARNLALSQSTLGVGCHIVLVDGEPVLPAVELPTLVNPATGRFRPTLVEFVRDLFLGRIRAQEIQAEAEAQIARLRDLGLLLTHVDTHKHTHMFPRVLSPVLLAAKRQGIAAIRNPFEPSWSLKATPGAPVLRRAEVHVLKRFQRGFDHKVRASGLHTTDGAIGVLATGTLNANTLASLLQSMPEGTWELVTHPGHADQDLARAGTRLIVSREVEFEALASLSFAADVELIHFGQLSAYGLDRPIHASTPVLSSNRRVPRN